MNIFLLELFGKYYLIMAAMFLLSSFIGYAVFRVCKIAINVKEYSAWFSSSSLGLLLLTVATAIYHAGFRSAMGVAVVVLVALLVVFKSENKAPNELEKDRSLKFGLEIIVASLLIYSIGFFMLFYHASYLATPHPDVVFYSKLSVYLPVVKMENNDLEYFYLSDLKTQPYHYFEAWLTSFVDSIFHANNLYLITLVIYNLLIFILYLGFYSMVRKLIGGVNHWAVDLFCLGCIFFSGVIFDFYKSVPLLNTMGAFARNPINYSKTSVIYIVITAAVGLELYGYKKTSILMLLMLPVLFISCAPSVMLGLFIYFLMYYFFVEKDFAMLAKNCSLLFFIAVLILIVYVHFDGKSQYYQSYTSDVVVDLQTKIWSYLRTCINVIIGTIIILLCLYFPVAVMTYLLRKKIKWLQLNLFTAGFFISIISLGVWAVLHQMPDSVQLFSNFSDSFFNVVSVLVMTLFIANLSDRLKVVGFTFVFFLLALSIVYTVSDEKSFEPDQQIVQRNAFYNKLRAKFEGINPLGVFFRDSSEYTNLFIKNSKFATPSNYLTAINDRAHQISLSIFEIPMDKRSQLFPFEFQMLSATTFYKFVELQKQRNEFRTVEKSQLEFIVKHNIKYAICTRWSTLPDQINGLVAEEIVEPVTGERIVFFK